MQEGQMVFRTIVGMLLILVLFGGCASVRKTHTSDGKEGYILNCSGTASTWGNCYSKAGDLCGEKGYEVLEKIGETLTSSSGNFLEQHSGTDMNRNLIIKCKQ
jgi:hypothetical protein